MKIFIALILLSLTTTTSAQNKTPIPCSSVVETQVNVIAAAANCANAIYIAEVCAMGDDRDVKLEAAANKVCAGKEMKSVPKADVELRKTMEKRCMLICDIKTDKSRCLSKISRCQLSAIRYMLHFYPQI